jgi:broad specificity phosphatase PhoE
MKHEKQGDVCCKESYCPLYQESLIFLLSNNKRRRKTMFVSLVFSLTILFGIITELSHGFLGNETEVLAYQALQAYASMPTLHDLLSKEIRKSVKVRAIPNLFAQQKGVKPEDGSYQLESFGALESWENILQTLSESSSRRLLILIRHGQAWENLNPTKNNALCEFELDGQTVQNFDSPLTPLGQQQSQDLNSLFLSPAANSSTTKSWYETLGLQQESTTFLASPLTRTMQTTQGVFANLPLSNHSNNQSFIVHELIRATIGRDVCNFRHSVKSSTSANPLPSPWRTGCEQIPSQSLEDIYLHSPSPVKFSFPIRPAGGEGFGLVSDYDELWRADVADEFIIETRATSFLGQVSQNTPASSVIAVVTHGEMVKAIYQAAGEIAYDPKNTEVVPLLIEFE